MGEKLKLKFEFDFEEVFEGIKNGVIKQMAELNVDDAKNKSIEKAKNEIKKEVWLTYTDVNQLKNEIKNEIKEEVFDKIIIEIRENYKKTYGLYFEKRMEKEIERVEKEISEKAYENIYNELYGNLYNMLQQTFKTEVQKIAEKFVQRLGMVGSEKNEIDKKEYEKLIERDVKLSKLENYGVDNWDGYSLALSE